jgi:hypothetical protein
MELSFGAGDKLKLLIIGALLDSENKELSLYQIKKKLVTNDFVAVKKAVEMLKFLGLVETYVQNSNRMLKPLVVKLKVNNFSHEFFEILKNVRIEYKQKKMIKR